MIKQSTQGKLADKPKQQRGSQSPWQEFSVPDLIGTLDVEEKARAKDTFARGIEGGSSANVVQKQNFQPHKFKNKGKFDGKASLMGRTSLCNTQTSRRRMARRKVLVMCVGILIIGLLVALIALTSVILRKVARPLMLSLETLT